MRVQQRHSNYIRDLRRVDQRGKHYDTMEVIGASEFLGIRIIFDRNRDTGLVTAVR